MKKAKCNIVIFLIGAFGYGLTEIIWRGRTHWSMLTAGGVSFLGLSRIADRFKKISLFKKAVIGCLFITLVEDIYGIIFNELLHKNVWDYSKMPLNFKGRICAVYSFFWFVLSLIFIPVASKLHNRLEG